MPRQSKIQKTKSKISSGPGSHYWLRTDKHGVDVWRIEIYLGVRDDGCPDRRKHDFHGNEPACLREKALFYAREVAKKAEKRLAASRMTVRQWAEEWLVILKKDDRSPTTLRSYRELLDNRILPGLGDHRLSDLAHEHIVHWLDDMVEQRCIPRKKPKPDDPPAPFLSEMTILKHYTVLKVMLQEAVYRRKIAANPAASVRPPKARRKKAVAYDNAEITPVRQALAGYHAMFRALVTLAVTCGARRGELVALEWRHIDQDQCTISIEQAAIYAPGVGQQIKDTKSISGVRCLNVPAETIAELKTWQEEQTAQRKKMGKKWQGSEYVFTNKWGRWIALDWVDRKLSRFIASKNLPKIRLHGLRHTVATRLLANDYPLADTAYYLGHAQNSTTLDIYVHSQQSNQPQAATIIEQSLTPKIPPIPSSTPENEHNTPKSPAPS